MKKNEIPLNLSLLVPGEDIRTKIREVKSLDIFLPSSKNFHPDGLFSIETFGISGTPIVYSKFGFIDIKISVLHPIVYYTITSSKEFYKDIISGKEYAFFDKDKKDFIKTDITNGETGYHFFLKHFKNLVFEDTNTIKREQTIMLLNKYKNNSLINKILVLPVGFREVEISESGRTSSDEINAIYYKIISISNTINKVFVDKNPEIYNSQRVSLQNAFNAVYDYLSDILDGKDSLIMGKWTSRGIFNGTRNVITSSNTVITDLDDTNKITMNDTSIGLFQTLKALGPVSKYKIKNGFLSKIFLSPTLPVTLVNKKTLLAEKVTIDNLEFNYWTTDEGLEKLINSYKESTIRNSVIEINDHYLCLLYRGKDNTFKLINGIDELPEGRNKEDCYPITYTELFYCSIYDTANSYPVYVTRYPITGVGSVYPSMVYLKSTNEHEVRQELGDDWEPIGNDKIAKQFPIRDGTFFNSVAPSSAALSKLGADFDGDTVNANILYSDEAIDEVNKFLKSKRAYINTDGTLIYDTNTDTVKYVLANMTS